MKKIILGIAAVFALGAALMLTPTAPAQADTANISVATSGVMVVPLHLDGQFTTTTTAVARIKLPFKAKVLGISASARASGGTTPTLTVDVKDDGTTMLSAPVVITAGAVAEATLANTQIADESVLTVDLAITGTSPTWDDIDVLLTIVRN